MRTKLPSGTVAELVHPPSRPASRGLVLVPDVMGMRPLFDDMAARLASWYGWSVCAFELYPGRETLDVAARLEVASTLADERVLGDAVAAAELTEAAKVGILGFCMGGMYTLKAVATGRFDRHCPFYGMIRVPDDWQGPGQGEPLDSLAVGDASSVLAVIGVEDRWTPPEDVERLVATGATVVGYEGADHGFVHDPGRPTYRADDALDAWDRAITWLSA